MNHAPRATIFAGTIVGASLLALIGPVAVADDAPAPDPSSSSDPCITGPLAPAPAVSAVASVQRVSNAKPDNPGKSGEDHGNADKTKNNGNENGDTDRTQLKTQDCIQDAKTERAALRDQIRLNGGSWGAYQRQSTLVGVAAKLAERHGATADAPNSASLGRILTLVNSSLPAELQIDVETFLAEYELTLADVTWPAADTDTAADTTE